MIVALELLTFMAGIVVFLYQKNLHVEEFAAGKSALNQEIAFANTLLLLTGGWLMAIALVAIRKGDVRRGHLRILGAAAAGIGFLVLKGIEYYEKVKTGVGFGEDSFYTIYISLTGFHFLHVLVAVVILLFLARALKRGRYTTEDHFDIESGGIFWHMCDLIWLLIYPAIYLV